MSADICCALRDAHHTDKSINTVPASQAFLSSPTMHCLWYQHPSAFAAECRHDSPGMLFVPKLHCLGRCWSARLCSSIPETSISSELCRHRSFGNMLVFSCTQTCLIRTGFEERYSPVGNLLSLVPMWPNPQLTAMYTLLSKSICFHPPGTKPSLKPPELIQKPKKPFNFTPSGFIRFSVLQLSPFSRLLSFFDNHSDWFQLGSD